MKHISEYTTTEWGKRIDSQELRSKIYSIIAALGWLILSTIIIYQCCMFFSENQALHESRIKTTDLEIKKYLSFYNLKVNTLYTITAYTSDPAETDDTPFIMANGKRPHEGVIACPREIPFDTKVEIEGKEYNCEDRMALKNDGKFDIWMPTKKQAVNFGFKILPVIIK